MLTVPLINISAAGPSISKLSELSSPLKSETSLNINFGVKYNPVNNLSLSEAFEVNFAE